MKILFLSLAALASYASASPAVLRPRNPAVTTDAFAATVPLSGSTVVAEARADDPHGLEKRATLLGDCSTRQKETVRRALYNCYRVAGRAAAVADTHPEKLKEFFVYVFSPVLLYIYLYI